MKRPRRRFLSLVGGAVALPALLPIARAQTYPTRPVRFIVPFPPGGPGDIVDRIVGQFLSQRLGQPVFIENRSGAGGNLGMQAVLNAAPDGYTIGHVGPNNAINATLYEKLPYNFLRDAAQVGGMMRVPNVMEVHPSVPARTVAEFIAYAKANPGKISFASSGIGTSIHMSGELFKMMAGVNMLHVPYRGSAPSGMASARPRARRPRSSTRSIRRSMRCWRILM
jgi:tripartite-type tricarboxylate transporter receptor subunit TctC